MTTSTMNYTVESSPRDTSAWTNDDFNMQIHVMATSQRAFVTAATRCTLFAVRKAMETGGNGSYLNTILANIGDKLRPSYTAWLFAHAPFSLKTSKDQGTITLDDGTSVELKSSIKFDAKRADDLCDLHMIPLLKRDKGNNIDDVEGMAVLLGRVLGALTCAVTFDKFIKSKTGTSAKTAKAITKEEYETKYNNIKKKLTALETQGKEAKLDLSKFPSIESKHGIDYYINVLENVDENDLTDKQLAKVRAIKGEKLPFRSILALLSNCDTSNMSVEEEYLYNVILSTAVDKNITL